MRKELRKTGISVVGDLPWGTHFCYFYETKQDLLDTLVPYFKAGLESKEFCLWIISKSELVTLDEAKGALGQAVPDLERYIAAGSIEIVSHDEWFLDSETFDLHRVANRFKKKLDRALARGYAGMRINGGPAWLQKKDRKQFLEFEQQLDNLFPTQRMIASCTYPLATTNGDDLFDVSWRHQFAIAKRNGQWEVYETPALKQAKAQIEKLNEELEQRVIERTRELATANEELRIEIAERKQAEEKLKRSESQLAEAQRVVHVGYWEHNFDTGQFVCSVETYKIFGLQPQEPLESFDKLIHPEDRSVKLETRAKTLLGEQYDVEYRVVRPDGEIRLVHSRGEAIRDESGRPCGTFGTVQDVTDLKSAEERLKATTEQLRALSARLQSAREEEGIRIAREIHDELGSALTSLRWDLEGIEKIFSESGNQPQVPALREKITAMLALTDTTINTVKRIASELRPSLLDDLGLIEAIKWQARQFQDRTGMVVHCDSPLDDVDFDQGQSTAAFRIFQEAMTNILRHAQATRVDVTMVEDAGTFVLTIRDNGTGITDEKKSGQQSIGLLGMQERAHLIGGEIDITGVEGEGTAVTVQLPIVRGGHKFGRGS